MKQISKKEDAVSPVVGVMLMLVVTIVIAAVVAAFAGGLGTATSATPQATFGYDLKYGNNLTINHLGGDALAGSNLKITTTIMTGSYTDMVSKVDLANATVVNSGDKLTEGVFMSGDILDIPWNDLFTAYADNTKNQIVKVSIIDTNSGNIISSKEITVM